MKAATRPQTQRERFDIRLAAGCLERNGAIVAEVLADEHAMQSQKREAKELLRLTELSLSSAVAVYLRQL